MAIAILVTYFAATIIIGVFVARRKRIKTTSEFFVANQGLSLWMIVPLLFGELIAGAGTIGNASDAYRYGIASVWTNWGMAIGCFICVLTVQKLYVRAGKVGVMTIPEVFELRFDRKCRNVMLIVTVFVYLLIFSTQPVAAAAILSPLFGVSKTVIACIISFSFALLTITGGIRGLSRLNTLHSIVMYGGLALVVVFAISKAGGLASMQAQLPASYFSLTTPGYPTIIAWFLGSAISLVTAATLARSCFSADSLGTARKGVAISGSAVVLFALMPAMIGIAAKAAMPDIPPNEALFDMANSIHPAFGGIVSMAVIAAIFSTGPGLMHIIANCLTKDFYVLLRPNASEGQQIRFSTICIIAVAVIGVIGGLNISSILSQLVGAFQIRSITGVVIIVATLWKRVNSTAAFWTMMIGAVIAAIWHFAGSPFGIAPFWPSLVCGVVPLVILTLTTQKGKVSAEYTHCMDVLDGRVALEQGDIVVNAHNSVSAAATK